jgi:Uma2 family endonuclease
MGAPLTIPRRLISVRDYHQMAKVGILGEDDRVELIEGELIQMAPIGGSHLQLVNLLTRLLVRKVGDDGVVSPQNPISLYPDSEPEPDLVVLRPECLYREEVPGVADVLLLIEISSSTLDYDRGVKVPLYAKHGVTEVWLFDTSTRSMTVFLDPTATGYTRVLSPKRGDTVTPVSLPKVQLSLTDIWP